jgi:C1A family cysteine protease
MRVSHVLAAASLAACAAPSDTARFSPPLISYDRLFHGLPQNGTLPELGKADGTIPTKSTDLLQYQSPVKDQNERGVCTIFTTTGLMEHLYIKAGVANPSFSEQYLQWAVKSELGSAPTSEGSNIPDNVQAIAQFGIVAESDDPYNGTEWTAANDPDCTPNGSETQELPAKCWTQGDPSAAAQAAQKYTLPQGTSINTSDIKAHIAQDGTAVAVSIDFFYQAWNHGLSTLPINGDDMTKGIVRYPNASDITASHMQQAGHGILLVGWDDDYQVQSVDQNDQPEVDSNGNPVMQQGFYIFKNSWGTDIFGVTNPYGAGYGMISEQYIDEFGAAYVDTLPDPNAQPGGGGGSGSGGGSCAIQCAPYGFTADQCYMGWQCDAAGQCLSQTASGTCP